MSARFAFWILTAILATDAIANSNGTSHTARTWRDVQFQPTAAQQDAASCGQCHGTRGTITVTLSGPTSLSPGQLGNYTVRLTGGTNGDRVGVIVSSTDSVAANPFGGVAPLTPASMTATSHNLVHVATATDPLVQVDGGAASYSFTYTMPAGAAVGSSRTLHAVMRSGVSSLMDSRWNHANIVATVPQGLVVTTTAAPPPAPTSLTNPAKTATTAQLNWTGTATAYRLVYKTGASAPATASDGSVVDLGNVSSTTVSNLTLGPTYTFRIYSRLADNSQFTAGPSLTVVLPPAINSSGATVNGTVGTALANYFITATNSPTSFGQSNIPPGLAFSTSTGLISGTPSAKGTYNATLSASNAGGTGTLSKTWVIAGQAQTVTFGAAPTPSFVAFGTFTVSASASSGQPVTYSTTSSAVCSISNPNVGTVTMLSAGLCVVRADQAGNSAFDPAFATQNVTIAASPPGAPSITGIVPGNGTATISFNAPSSDGGSSIGSYSASCTPGPVTAQNTVSPIVVTGLANGTLYSCTVTATNSAGPGTPSAPVGVTPTADPDGRLDPFFGTAGLSAPVFANTGAGESLRAIVVDSSQRILVGGSGATASGTFFAVARFLPDGALDTKFGKNGVAVIEPIGASGAIEGLALDARERILFAGGSEVSGNNVVFTIGRLLGDGTLDESFGSGGFLKVPAASAEQGVARTIAYDGLNDAVYAAGWDKTSGKALRAVIVRTDARGALDAGFGKDGILSVPLGVAAGGPPEGATTGLAVDSSGRAVASGFFSTGTSIDLFVLRADPRGLDESFGSGGVATHDTGGSSDVSFSMRLDEKQRPNLVGYTNVAVGFDFLIVRFTEDGAFDSQVVSDQGSSPTDLGIGLVITGDGKRLVGGVRNAGANSFDFAFARFLDGGALDTSYGGSGRTTISNPGSDQLIAMQAQRPGTVVAAVQTGGQQRIARFAIESPIPFGFTPASVTAIGTTTLLQSNTVALQGLAGETYVVVQGGEWSRNCAPGGFTTLDGVVTPGDSVCVRHVTAGSVGVTVTTTLVVGSQSATFSSTPNSVVPPKTLSVAKAGSGAGTVFSAPSGISCGATCNFAFPTNQPVTLSASAGTGSLFTGWSGACTGTGACSVTMDAVKSVTATFALQQFTLSVSKAGAGSGTVASDVGGIACGTACSANLNIGTTVTLTATPAAGSLFTGWSGDCAGAGTGACILTMDATRSVSATFALAVPASTFTPASVAFASTQVGTAAPGQPATLQNTGTAPLSFTLAVSAPAEFSATHACGGSVAPGASCSINLGFTPSAAGLRTATLTVTSNDPVTPSRQVALSGTGLAPPAPSTFALTVAKTGGGSGVVTSTPGGIDCGATCNANFNSGVVVALGAAPSSDSFFAGWSGGGCSGTGACNVTMDAAKTVTATFKLNTTIPRLANISTRMQVLTGADVLIGGFIIGGSQPKTVVVRARGPSLIPLGVPNALANPVLQLFSGATQIDANDNWQQAANQATILSSGFAPSDPLESAIHTTLAPGAYTAIVTGANLGTGVAIIEVFEVDRPEVPLLNIATRGKVLTGGDVMIGGFIIQGDAPQTVVVRARGPSLTAAGVPGALQDPVLQLFAGPTQIGVNDDWQASPNAVTIQSSGFAPSDSRESVIRITLNPGAYTAIVTGKNGTTGVGIIEVFAQ